MMTRDTIDEQKADPVDDNKGSLRRWKKRIRKKDKQI